MQVQKGLVKYKDRSDILCTYGITDDGKTYYFLEGNTIPNGNIVATTVLVEAIDPLVVSSSIGVIDPDGNVVIPFENKAVKPLNEDLLLVEIGTPVSDSVIEACELRGDPSAASKLVSTPAAIKETMHLKMGDSGRFVFNDQFSEATICDMNGVNLVNDELFSFIGLTDERIYLSKNNVGSFIWEFDIAGKTLDVMPEVEVEATMGDGDASEFTVDVSAIASNEEGTEFATEDVPAVSLDDLNKISEESTEVATEDVVSEESGFAPEEVVLVENPEPETEPVTEAVVEETTEPEIGTEPATEVVEESTDLFAMTEEDIFADAKVQEDKLVDVESYEDFAYFPEHSSKDSLIQEVTATVTDLVKLNRTQRQKLVSYEQRMDQMADANRKLTERLREQSKDYEKLRTTAENFKTVVGKLEAKCEVLEGKNEALESRAHDQERTIYRLNAENTSLREQNLNNEVLAQVLAEARSALDSDEEDLGYYRKAA